MSSVLASSEVDGGFIGGIMSSVLASSEVDRGFAPRSGQTKDNYILPVVLSSWGKGVKVAG